MTEVSAGSAGSAVPAVKVGVRLHRVPEPVGQWLAEAAAFDAGGADSLWVDLGAESELDVVAVAGALAAVTFRARLVVAFPAGTPDRAVDTVGRLCHGRLALIGGSTADGSTEHDSTEHDSTEHESTADDSTAHDSTAHDSTADGSTGRAAYRRQQGEPGVFVGSDGRFVSVPVPQGRESWRAGCAMAVERHGASGVIVPADQRLLDILRNPEPGGGRHDLQLAQG